MLAVWSAYPDPDFTDRLRTNGFDVREVPFTQDDGERPHTVWLAARPD